MLHETLGSVPGTRSLDDIFCLGSEPAVKKAVTNLPSLRLTRDQLVHLAGALSIYLFLSVLPQLSEGRQHAASSFQTRIRRLRRRTFRLCPHRACSVECTALRSHTLRLRSTDRTHLRPQRGVWARSSGPRGNGAAATRKEPESVLACTLPVNASSLLFRTPEWRACSSCSSLRCVAKRGFPFRRSAFGEHPTNIAHALTHRKTYGNADLDNDLRALGLVPLAVLLVQWFLLSCMLPALSPAS